MLRKGDPTPENRGWEFFAAPHKTRLENRLQAPELHRENRLTSTKTASGIPVWPSRDPLGERGGMNLYGFVGNDGVNGWDFLGLIEAALLDLAVEPLTGLYNSKKAAASGFGAATG